MTDLLKRAEEFARKAHAGQYRKFSGEDYIVHPIKLKDTLLKYGIDHEEFLAAALLHDTVEDTKVTFKDINDAFGPEIARHVWFLTKEANSGDTKRFRSTITTWKLEMAPSGVQMIKAADILDNASTMKHDDIGYWNNGYKTQCNKILDCMSTYVKTTALWKEAHNVCN